MKKKTQIFKIMNERGNASIDTNLTEIKRIIEEHAELLYADISTNKMNKYVGAQTIKVHLGKKRKLSGPVSKKPNL